MKVQRKRTPARRDFTALSRGQKAEHRVQRTTNNEPRTTNKDLRTTNYEPRATDSALADVKCEDCEHSVPAGGATGATLICRHKADTDLPWQVVDSNGGCRNFERSRELAPVDIAAALADGARLIPLTQDKFVIVDAEDYDRLSKYNWHVEKKDYTSYAVRSVSKKSIPMHREILDAPPGLVVDHINHNGLDNRKQNLRLCTQAENIYNSVPSRNCSSKYKGVYRNKKRNRYIARICSKGKRFHLGYFDDEVDAAKAYDKAAKKLFGKFAYLNFPDP